MNKLLLSVVLLLAFQEDACNKPTLCDEHCLRDKRVAAMPIPDGSTVIAEGAKEAGTLRLSPNAPPVIVYADGSTQSATDVRIVMIPTAAPLPKLPQRPGVAPEVAER